MTLLALRSLLHLPDLLNIDEPESNFAVGVALVAWDCREKTKPCNENDATLNRLNGMSPAYFALVLYLASIDENFLRLAKRMAARSLARDINRPLSFAQRHLFAHLMTADKPPGQKTTLARNVALIVTIAQTRKFGWLATESGGHSKTGKPSTCRRIVEALLADHGVATVTYGSIEDVWKPSRRESILHSAGFSVEHVSELLA